MKGFLVKVAARGFGFASTSDHSPDVFIPAALLARNRNIAIGDAIEYTVATDQGGNGRRFATSLRLDEEAPSKPQFVGTVKGDLDRGYCFVVSNDHSLDDAFLHLTTIERAGLKLRAGDQVVYEVENNAKYGNRPFVTKLAMAA